MKLEPVIQPIRRIPYHLREKLDRKLNELVDLDIIEPVDGPSQWISPVVLIPKKNGDIRICVDMRRANQAFTRERYPIPTVDEVKTLHRKPKRKQQRTLLKQITVKHYTVIFY